MIDVLCSVIIPSYNRPEKLVSLVHSLLRQKFEGYEIIIVDSSSVSVETQLPFSKTIHIKYFYSSTRLGVTAARNMGASFAKGKYLVFLDDDDQVSENWLADYAALAVENNFPHLLFCGMGIVKASGPPEDVLPNEKLWRIIIPGSFVISTDFFNSIGRYDERILYGENTELFIRIRRLKPTQAMTDTVNFFYQQSESGGSKNLKNKIESNLLVLEKHKSHFEKHLRIKKLFLQVVGVSLLRLKKFQDAKPYLKEAYKLDRRDFKAMLRLMVSYVPLISKRIYAD
jgi:glycosyltransferase involved in cell wall biosynthesis